MRYRGLLLLLLLATASAIFCRAEYIYGPGDWLRYRFSLKGYADSAQVECLYTLHVDIENVTQGFAVVKYSLLVERGDVKRCRDIRNAILDNIPEREIVLPEVRDPSSTSILINPHYSGVYNVTTPLHGDDYALERQAVVAYYKGVLIHLNENISLISPDLRAAIYTELLLTDTSIDELKHVVSSRASATPSGSETLMLYIVLGISIAVSAVSLAYIFKALRKVRKLRVQQVPRAL